jgi:hypothetical protein
MAVTNSASLYRAFHAIDQETRDAHQDFSIRLWRGMSWLQCSELAEDVDTRYMLLWVAFNATYGAQASQFGPRGDREAWNLFLSTLDTHDRRDQLGAILREHQTMMLDLIDNQFLFGAYWDDQPDWEEKFTQMRQAALNHMNQGITVRLLRDLFERLYVLRNQLFHGQATWCSKTNRSSIEPAMLLLSHLLPAILSIMLDAGPEIDWGAICYPPIDE